MTILQKINSLQYYDGLKGVKDVLKSIFSAVTALETNSVLIFKTESTQNLQTSGLLIVGKYYQLTGNLIAGDNFTNVGLVALASGFIATGTTPNSWNNATQLERYTVTFTEVYNDTLGSLSIVNTPTGERLKFTVSNNTLIDNKIFIFQGSYEIINSNNIYLSGTKGKLEIYN